MKTKIYHRHSIRMQGYDYTQNGCYFLTICTRNRECLFGEIQNAEMFLSNIGEKVNDCWQEIPKHFPQIVLHEYVIMPNHVHGIIEINNPQSTGANMDIRTDIVTIGANVVGVGTNAVGVGANNYSPLRTPQSRPNGTSRTVGSVVRGFKIGVTKQMGFSPWQRNYYEHIIRNDESYQNIVQYMAQNPMKWEEDCFYYEAQKTTM